MEINSLFVLGMALVSAAYSALLARLQHIYSPDHIWVTVVGGNALIGGMFAWWLLIVPLLPGGDPLAAFWRLLMLNIAAGLPVIAWQVGQNAARKTQRADARREPRDSSATGRPSVDRPNPRGSGRS